VDRFGLGFSPERLRIGSEPQAVTKPDRRLVYSTTGSVCIRCGWPEQKCQCASTLASGREPVPAKVTAKLRLEKRGSGKSVTVVDGLPNNAEHLAALAKEWKRACGTGGSVGSGSIELQGDQRERLREILEKKGWKVKG
jgi:translation initiation factor 1